MHDRPVSFVLNYQQTGKYALNVLVGSIMTRQNLRDTPIYFSKYREELVANINEAKQHSKHVLVGWSFYSPQFLEISDELQHIKQQTNQENVMHIAGGVHATAEPQQTLAAGFDLVAVGEGEQIIGDLLSAFIDNEDTHQVRGIAYLDNGELKKNGKGETIDLNDYPPSALCARNGGQWIT